MKIFSQKKVVIFLSVILLITIIAFSNSIGNDFTNWDDSFYVTDNEYIKDFSLSGIRNLFTNFYSGNYHPLTALSNAIEYRIFGPNPHVFHFFNLFIHLLNVVLVFYFAYLLSNRLEVSVIVAVFFAIHPMHVESVAWIAERKDVLYSFFYLGSLIAYISPPLTPPFGRGKTPSPLGRDGVGLSLFLFLLSLLSKSAAVTLPLILLLIDFYFQKKFNKKNILEKIPFFILSLIFGITAIYSQKTSGAMDIAQPHTLLDKIFLPSYSICLYIFKMFLPVNLCSIYFYPEKTNGWLPNEFYLSLILIVLIVLGIYKSGKYRKDLIFGVLFFLISIALNLQVMPVGSALAAERYTYLSYIGLFFIIGQFYCRISDVPSDFAKKATIILIVFLTGSVLTLSIITFNRNKVWKNGVTLFSDVIAKNPNEFMGYHGRGLAKSMMKDYEGAIADFSVSYQFPNSYMEKGLAKEKLNDIDGAMDDYLQAIRIKPDYEEAYYNRGALRMNKLQDYEGAIADFTEAIRILPEYSQAFNDRAIAKEKLNDMDGALADYTQAIRLYPKYAEAYFNRGSLKLSLKDYEGAIEDFNEVIQIDKKDAEAYYSRGVAKLNLNKINGGCDDLHKAVELGYVNAKELIGKYCP